MARQGTYLGGSTLLTFGRKYSSDSGWEPESIVRKKKEKTGNKKKKKSSHYKQKRNDNNLKKESQTNTSINEHEYIKKLSTNYNDGIHIFHLAHKTYMTQSVFLFYEYVRICAINDFFSKPRPKLPSSINLFNQKIKMSRKAFSKMMKNTKQYKSSKDWLRNWKKNSQVHINYSDKKNKSKIRNYKSIYFY
jgi:hypothetical protein